MQRRSSWFDWTAVAMTAAFLAAGAANAQRGGSRSTGGKMEVPVQKSGKVVMEDGSPLPEPVLVEASCGGGAATPIARTDSKGGFIVGRGRDSDVDARTQRGGAASAINMAGCALVARLPGYDSSVLRVVDNQVFDLGTIVLRRQAGVEGSMFSPTSQRAPKDAQKAFEKGKAAMEKKKIDQARPALEKAVEVYPDYAEAWCELGRAYQAAGDVPKARQAYERAIQIDPKFVKPYMGAAAVYHREQNWKAASEATAKLIKLDPNSFVAAYVMNAISNMRLGDATAAEASARQALKRDTEHQYPEAEYSLGLILGARGEYKEGIEHLKAFLQLAPNSSGAENVKLRIAEFEKAAQQ